MRLDYGIYRIKRRKLNGSGDHYGVLSVGVLAPWFVEVVDFGRDGFHRQPLDTWIHDKPWSIVGRCPDHEIPLALGRLRQAVYENRGYHWWKNNCEHVATWVVVGDYRSSQVKAAADLGAVLGAATLVGASVALIVLATRESA